MPCSAFDRRSRSLLRDLDALGTYLSEILPCLISEPSGDPYYIEMSYSYCRRSRYLGSTTCNPNLDFGPESSFSIRIVVKKEMGCSENKQSLQRHARLLQQTERDASGREFGKEAGGEGEGRVWCGEYFRVNALPVSQRDNNNHVLVLVVPIVPTILGMV